MSKITKKKLISRERTKFRIRKKISGTEVRPRITVFKSSKHTYAQLVSDTDGKTIVSASTLDKDVVAKLSLIKSEGKNSTKSVTAAKIVGEVLAERSVQKNLNSAVFDRNGFNYTGRIRAVAEGARANGLVF